MDLLELNGILVQGGILVSGIVGQLFVSNLDVRGFYWWILGNVLMVAVSIAAGLIGMAVLYCFYTVMAVRSITVWRRKLGPGS